MLARSWEFSTYRLTKNIDEGSSQTLWLVHESLVHIAYASSEGSGEPENLSSIITTFAARTETKKRWRWRFRPTNFVPSKAVVLLLLIHSLMFLPLNCGDSVFVPCLVRHYLVFFLVMQPSWRGRENMIPYFNFLPTINALWLLLVVPWVGLKCVIVGLPDHTHLRIIGKFMRIRYLLHKRTS